ncbi:BglG family transcription antiterminator [Pseudogracilibacillus sp. SO30301A]|uniref:BglG family transcription antiterminator n=1 Tax=Pseudogracilibacillus sp. SO30301A TaxID=3098291 RepID=UPI00300E5D45
MEASIVLSSRQKELLRTLLNSNKPVTYKQLADFFKLSTRTIQREIKSLTMTLDQLDIKVTRKFGSGLILQGSEENIKRLKAQIKKAKIMSAYTPEERQEGITYDLLLANSPLKQEFFSKKYDVSIATIAFDLDKIRIWLEAGGVMIHREPGIGIYINASEQQRRTLLSRLLHKDITFEDWIELFHEKKTVESMYGKLGSVIRNRLLKFVQTDKILDVDRVLNDILNEQPEFILTDRNYVNLMIHIMLAMERIQSGKVIENTNLGKWEPFDHETLSLAKKIVKHLEQVSSLTFPEIEVNYISLHLAGAKVTKKQDMITDQNEEFTWIELTQSFIRSVEFYLDESFEGDQLLFEGLVSHFVPVFNRLKFGLQIHNPMLEKIKEQYPAVFTACATACELLTEKTGYEIPEDEVGYLAMHIGASLLRIEEGLKEKYKAIVVCASGLGTSMYLSTKIRSEIKSIEVEAVVSVNELSDWLKEDYEIDIIISTVNLPYVEKEKMVVVSPFLKKEDIAKIRNSIINQEHIKIERLPIIQNNNSIETHSLLSLATYGEGLLQILKNFKFFNNVRESSDIITSVVSLLEDVNDIVDHRLVTKDLKKREELGGFVLNGLAMIHTKSAGVTYPIVAVFRTGHSIPWKSDDGNMVEIQTILLLVIPSNAPLEHMKMISEIPASFIDNSFVEEITSGNEDSVKAKLEEVLTKAFELKITRSVKELQNQ